MIVSLDFLPWGTLEEAIREEEDMRAGGERKKRLEKKTCGRGEKSEKTCVWGRERKKLKLKNIILMI